MQKLFSLSMPALSILAVALVFPARAEILPGDMPLTTAFAEKLLNEKLLGLGGADDFEITIDRPSLPLGNQDPRPTSIVLDGLHHDETSGRFRAIMIGTVEGEPRFELPIEGRLRPMVSIAVLSRPIARGELISAADLEWKMVAPDMISKASLTDEAELVGAEARRRLSPGRMLSSRDVGAPRLVQRGQPVRVIYAEGGMRLTALGTARDDGALGDTVRVLNPESRLEIQGVATGPKEVTVGGRNLLGAGS